MKENLHSKKSGGTWAVSVEGPLLIAIFLASLGCVAYAIYTRSAANFFRLPLMIASALAVITFFLSLISSTQSKGLRKAWSCFKAGMLAWIASAVFLTLAFGVGGLIFDAYEFAWNNMTLSDRSSLFVGFCTLLVGTLFFWVRTIWRVTYGVSEALAGIAIASYRAHGQTDWWPGNDLNFYVILLTAGIYLVVRGFDNINQGRGQARDPVVRVVSWLKAQVYTDDPEKVAAMYGEPSTQATESKKSLKVDPDTSQ